MNKILSRKISKQVPQMHNEHNSKRLKVSEQGSLRPVTHIYKCSARSILRGEQDSSHRDLWWFSDP